MKLKEYNAILCILLILIFSKSVKAQNYPSLYLIGDSTMADKKNPESNPEHGWGQVLPEFLKEKVIVNNHAVNGRSSKSFRDEGRWQVVLDSLKKGDYVLIQFGHNDEKIADSTRYTFPFTSYRYNLERYVTESREKGAIPILLSPIVRRNFNENGVLVDTHGNYPLVVRMVAQELEVPFVDMQYYTELLENKWGMEGSKELHLHFEPGEHKYYDAGKHDDTHLSYRGAREVALLAVKALKRQVEEFKNLIDCTQENLCNE